MALEHSSKEEFETAWLEAVERGAPAAQFVELVPQLPADWRDRLLPNLLAALCDQLDKRGQWQDGLTLVRSLSSFGLQIPDVRARLVRWLKASGGNEEWLEAMLKITNLAESRNLVASLDQLDRLLYLTPGRTVDHPSGWGAGRITDFRGGELVVMFEDGKTRELGVNAARDILRPLDPRDIRSRKLADREGLQRDVAGNPAEVLVSVLMRFRGKANATQIKQELLGSVVPEAQWNRFWKEAKAGAENHPYIAVEGGSRPTFLLRSKPISLKEEAMASLQKAEGEPDLAARAYRYLATGQEEVVSTVIDFLRRRQAAGTQHPELDLILHAHGDASATERLKATMLERPLHQTLASLSSAASRETALRAFVDLSNGQWQERLAGALTQLPEDLYDQAIDLLEKQAPDRLAALLAQILPFPSRTPILVLRLVRRVLSGSIASKLKPEALGTSLLRLTESISSTPGRLTREQKEMLKRAEEILVDKKHRLLEKLLQKMDDEDLRALHKLASKMMHFPESLGLQVRDVAQARLPDTRGRQVPFWELEDYIYVTASGLQRKHDEFRVLTHEKIPQNSANIARALGYGDLSENAEWSAAMEEQRLLTELAARMKAELDKARLLEEQDIPEGVAAPGMRVTYRINGQESAITILGPWDVPSEGVISYQAPLAKALLSRGAGERVSAALPSGEAVVDIVAIERVIARTDQS
jgi:transcription elongation factor GreA